MTRVVVSCGALALQVKQIAVRRGWDVEVRPVPPELHNRPERIRTAVQEAAKGDEVVVAYAHCGADLAGFERLSGAHCYEVYGAEHEPASSTCATSSGSTPRSRQRICQPVAIDALANCSSRTSRCER